MNAQSYPLMVSDELFREIAMAIAAWSMLTRKLCSFSTVAEESLSRMVSREIDSDELVSFLDNFDCKGGHLARINLKSDGVEILTKARQILQKSARRPVTVLEATAYSIIRFLGDPDILHNLQD